jgi:hypothetical protein
MIPRRALERQAVVPPLGLGRSARRPWRSCRRGRPRYAARVARASRFFSFVRGATTAYARADLALERALSAVRLAAEGVLGHALSVEEKTALTIALYDLQAPAANAPLWSWEEQWYAQVLPAAPARLLLAAAGSGRELLPLCAAGYQVDAFEPSLRHAARLRVQGVDAACGSFADLIAAALHGEVNALSRLARRRYDAVVLGWGSFTHVLEPDARADLLRVCDRLAGNGPVLASFWLEQGADTRSRALRLGASLGQRLAAWRGLGGLVSEPPDGQMFRTHCGFVHRFREDEIEALAKACGRQVDWGYEGYPHATLRKR